MISIEFENIPVDKEIKKIILQSVKMALMVKQPRSVSLSVMMILSIR